MDVVNLFRKSFYNMVIFHIFINLWDEAANIHDKKGVGTRKIITASSGFRQSAVSSILLVISRALNDYTIIIQFSLSRGNFCAGKYAARRKRSYSSSYSAFG